MSKTIRDYFGIKELVCKDVYYKFGEKAWEFFDTRLLCVLLWIREGTGLPIVVNNWHKGGNLSQRGLRCNLCQIVAEKTKKGQLYLTTHGFGEAVDFDVIGMTSQQTRQWIINNKHNLPYPIRMELDTPTWTHIDVRNNDTNNKIILFRA